MKTKKSKTIWIVLAVIVLVIGALSIMNCVNSRESVNYSEFYSVAMQDYREVDGETGIKPPITQTILKTDLDKTDAKVIIKNINRYKRKKKEIHRWI